MAQTSCAFPECSVQGYSVDPAHVADVAIDLSSPAFHDMLEELKPLEPAIVVGLIEKEGGNFYNTALAIERGTVVARYRKTYLLRGEKAVFQPGEAFPVFDVLGVRVGINICYDLNFSESVQRASDAGVTLLACPCSNMMRRDVAEEWKPRHNEIRSRQARDHGVWILSADITGERDDYVSYGPTAVIDPSGTVVAQVPLSETGMVMAEIEYVPERQRAARYHMTDEIVFYTNPMSRGRTVRWMLEEVGAPYRVEVLEFGTTMKSPEYLAINPMGKVPAIRHGNAVVTESAAICAYLADAFPAAQMAPLPTMRAAYLPVAVFRGRSARGRRDRPSAWAGHRTREEARLVWR